MFEKILKSYAMFVDTATRNRYDGDGKEIGLSNTPKQMLGQSGQTGQAKIKIGDDVFDTNLGNWAPARSALGHNGEIVMPNLGGATDAKTLYLSGGFEDKQYTPPESAFLISWLAMSIVNGHLPTSGSGNVEASHKANALMQLVEKYPIVIEHITIPGPSIKGYKIPDIVYTHDDIISRARVGKIVSEWMLDNLRPKARNHQKIAGVADFYRM